jgi:hypothetical protein
MKMKISKLKLLPKRFSRKLLKEDPMKRFFQMVTIALLFSASILSLPVQASLVCYPWPNGFPNNSTYTVQVREPGGTWQNLFVYNVMVVCKPNGANISDVWNIPTSMVNFSFSNTIEMKVTFNRGNIHSYEIRPASFGITPVQNGNTLTFNVTQIDTFPRKFVLRVNDDWAALCLHVIGNHLEVNPPSQKDVTYYFGPGIYNEEQTSALRSLKSGDKVYIAGGAIIRGGIRGSNISNVWIGGRGIIDIQRRVGDGCVLYFTQCSNITVDGVTGIVEAGGWAVRFIASDHMTLSNFALFGALTNSDGIHFDGSQNCVATGCFLRSSDDLMLVNGTNDGIENCIDNTFKNSVVWGDKAHIFVAGFQGNVSKNNITKNILFQNIDVINHVEGSPGFRGVIKIWCTRNQIVRDITFNDIRIMPFQYPSQAEVIQIQLAPNYAYNNEGLAVRNITIRNLSYTGSGEVQSLIYGQSAERYVDSVLFINYTRNGALVTDTTNGNMTVGPYAYHISFSRR